jgi:hypothetical protein
MCNCAPALEMGARSDRPPCARADDVFEGGVKVLYFCEASPISASSPGCPEICDLTMAAPAWEFRSSGLAIASRRAPHE